MPQVRAGPILLLGDRHTSLSYPGLCCSTLLGAGLMHDATAACLPCTRPCRVLSAWQCVHQSQAVQGSLLRVEACLQAAGTQHLFRPVAAPAHLITDVKHAVLDSFGEGPEEEEEGVEEQSGVAAAPAAAARAGQAASSDAAMPGRSQRLPPVDASQLGKQQLTPPPGELRLGPPMLPPLQAAALLSLQPQRQEPGPAVDVQGIGLSFDDSTRRQLQSQPPSLGLRPAVAAEPPLVAALPKPQTALPSSGAVLDPRSGPTAAADISLDFSTADEQELLQHAHTGATATTVCSCWTGDTDVMRGGFIEATEGRQTADMVSLAPPHPAVTDSASVRSSCERVAPGPAPLLLSTTSNVFYSYLLRATMYRCHAWTTTLSATSASSTYTYCSSLPLQACQAALHECKARV